MHISFRYSCGKFAAVSSVITVSSSGRRKLLCLNLDTHDLEAKILYVYNHINEFHNTEELCQWLKDLCHLLCRKLDSSMNYYHQKLCELVISHINEHYTDNTLCLNDIAASANVSPAYLSALVNLT